MSETGPILTVEPARAEVEMGSITPYESAKGRRYLSHDQVATLAACSAYPTLVLTLAYTGLRRGEATGLRVRSVYRPRRRFVIEGRTR